MFDVQQELGSWSQTSLHFPVIFSFLGSSDLLNKIFKPANHQQIQLQYQVLVLGEETRVRTARYYVEHEFMTVLIKIMINFILRPAQCNKD